MNQTMVIAGRELRERSRIFLMAAAMAVLPFLSALVPAVRNDRALAIAGVGGFIALALALGVSIAQGTSTIAGELVARRMSFYFSKPVSPAAIWFGKVIAALTTSFLCLVIVAGPAFLSTGNQWKRTFGTSRLLLFAAIAIVVMFLVSHTLSTMVRSRSGLVGVDFVLAAVSGAALFYILRSVFFGGPDIAKTLGLIVAVAIAVILFAAPVWQLAQGRSDIRRSHAALSRAIWTSVAVVLVAAGAYAAWVVNVDPTDLTSYGIVQQSPGGNTLFVTGTAKGRGDYSSAFLVDMNSGRYERMNTMPWWGAEFSQDGKVVALMEPVWSARGRVGQEIYTKRLDQPDAPVIASGIRKGGAYALSPDGSRIVAMNDSTISVSEVATRRILTSLRRGNGPVNANVLGLFFPNGNDVVRLYQWPRGTKSIEIYELDVNAKSLTKTGAIDSEDAHNGMRVSADGTRVLLPRNGVIADARTGATLAKLPVTTPSTFSTAILSDGSAAVMKRDTPRVTKLFLFAPDGTQRYELSLPTHFAWISGESDGQKLVAIGYDKPGEGDTGRHRKMFVIDTVRGTIERTLTDIKGPVPNFHDPRISHFRADEKLVAVNAKGELVTWNAATGAITPLPSPR